MSLGITEIVLILIVVIVLFGGKKIPELARGLGKAQAEYKKAREAVEKEVGELKAEAEKLALEKKEVKPAAKTSAKKKSTAKKTAAKKKTTAPKKTTAKKKTTVKKKTDK